MDTKAPESIAIVGAGLAGLTLALSLKLYCPSIKLAVYELRNPTASFDGAVNLGPNSLKILDKLGIYQKIKNGGSECWSMAFIDENNKTTQSFYLGHEDLFGYACLRIHRKILLRELKTAALECGITVLYGRSITRVKSETENSVNFELDDGTEEKASLVIGADGIHSKVRRFIHPDASPIYSGNMAIIGITELHHLRFPAPQPDEPTYPLPATILAKPGAFFLAPQNPSGTELMIGTQVLMPEKDRAGWEKIRNSKEKLLSFLQRDQKSWPDIVQSAIENVNVDGLSIWPFYVIPRLSTWISPQKRVIIVGDAAHAIPPSAGQGAGQAMEDVYSLAYLLSKLGPGTKVNESLQAWEDYRKKRVSQVTDLTERMNNMRLPAEMLAKLPDDKLFFSEGPDGLRWLFMPMIDESIEKLIVR